LPEYTSFAAIEAACETFMDEINHREHRATKRKPAVMLEEERLRLHAIPDTAHTVAFGLSRRVPDNTPMVTFDNGRYSVPSYLSGAHVFVRTHGAGPDEQIVIVHPASDGPLEVARHGRARPGSPAIDDAHFPDHTPKQPGDYVIFPKSKAEAEFLAIGEGARAWLLEAASVGGRESDHDEDGRSGDVGEDGANLRGFRRAERSIAGTRACHRSRHRRSRHYGRWNGSGGKNMVVCGPSGTGKTFFLEALGQHVVDAGMRVAWFRLEDLGALMRAHRSDDSITRVVARILRANLIVIDDIGLLPVGRDAAEGLYRLVDAAYEKRSIAVSSNLHPAAFDGLMPKTLATATVNRLLHHAHICQTTGESIRLTEALAGKGVTPMS
jgi:hypothetical protein